VKLDMGEAWTTATALMGRNHSVVAIIAGVFFLLPYLTAIMLVPELPLSNMQFNSEDPQAMADMIDAFLDELTWLSLIIFVLQTVLPEPIWLSLIILVLQTVGALALIVLLTDRARPTVGEALKRGLSGSPTYIATTILYLYILYGFMLMLTIVIMVDVAQQLLRSPSNAQVLFMISSSIVATLYLMIRFSLVPPAIAIDGILNPIKAINRSWRLTRRNIVRLFIFFALLIVAFLVPFFLVAIVCGVILDAIGGQIEFIGNALIRSLGSAVLMVMLLGVITAVHKQFAGDRPKSSGEVLN